jgi:hypothetical protein
MRMITKLNQTFERFSYIIIAKCIKAVAPEADGKSNI